MEFVGQGEWLGEGNAEIVPQEMQCKTVLIAVVEALNRGASTLTIHADGDVKTDLGGWEEAMDGLVHSFTSSTIRSESAPGADIVAELSLALCDNTTLASLNMVRHKLDAASVRPLVDALTINRSLRYLHLGQNKLGDDGSALLAGALRSPEFVVQASRHQGRNVTLISTRFAGASPHPLWNRCRWSDPTSVFPKGLTLTCPNLCSGSTNSPPPSRVMQC